MTEEELTSEDKYKFFKGYYIYPIHEYTEEEKQLMLKAWHELQNGAHEK